MIFSLKASIKDGQHKVQSGTHPSEKQLMAELFRNDSVSDNDTPVLPKGGRPAEILPGVRVPWSGSQPPSQVFALASGEVVSNTDANEIETKSQCQKQQGSPM